MCLAPHHIHITSCPSARCLETVCFCLDSKPRQPQPNDDRYCCPIFPHISDLKTSANANLANLIILLLLLRILFSAPTAYDTLFGKEVAGCESVWEANRESKKSNITHKIGACHYYFHCSVLLCFTLHRQSVKVLESRITAIIATLLRPSFCLRIR